METKKVTPEMIDDALAERIANADGVYVTVPLVRRILAYLANNPIEPTDEQIEKAWAMPWQVGLKTYQNMFIQLQRIAYLKKEEELPREVQQMIDSFGEERFPDIAGCIRKAYKIGAKLK